MKKITTKKPSSPAPAKKNAATAKLVKTAIKKTAVKAVVPRQLTTAITAQIDIGFGNVLYIRGDGPGLSWDRGVVMNCVADNQWRIALPESARAIVFKFLVNDLSWSAGEDYTTAPGAAVVLTPTF